MKRVALLALLLAAMVQPAAMMAQRAPVLQQIKVPHPYYYREMFIPEPTTGPSSVAWSPDGKELVYSMQGSLWRQRVGSTEARQLTQGYDYQPDWSPDGRQIVYASYRRDEVDLRVLNLATGESKPLVSDGSVNLEPRWSPDGRRIAFTSTAYMGRWHVFVASIQPDGHTGPSERVTEDRDSNLPRYYYHRFDQYLSPTWSPDGRELLLVSNRGHIWGSGGFWRMAARSGATPRDIHYEETTWKARPDWSRDGKRVVYSSYLGRQWHQLWLMTADGGDPFQLTYGEFDAVGPRWSPDGKQIAYISNEEGNTSLWVVDVPGGQRHRVVVERRIYLRPVARLRIVVSDSTGLQIPARISLIGPDARYYAPDDVWRYADDGFDRRERVFEYQYFHTSGSSTVTLPTGAAELELSRGPEYRVESRHLGLQEGDQVLRVRLSRLADLPSRGWYSGDLHVHMNYGGAYRNDPAHLAEQARAEDLHVVENLIVNKEGRIPDVGYFRGTPDPVSTPTTLIVHGEEFHTSFWGHVGLLGLKEHLLLPGYAAYANTAVASLQPTNASVLDLTHAQGGIGGYVHPFDSYPEPGDSTHPLTAEFPVDVALGKVDYYEALGFVDDPMATARVWYQILNCGFALPAGAGTDAMANFASLRGPVGMNRVFVRSGAGAPLEHRRWLAALKRGRSFATNGPLLQFSVNGRELGDTLRVDAGVREVSARVSLWSNAPVDHLEIVGKGSVVREVPLKGNRKQITTTISLPVDGSGWFLLRARTDSAVYPVLDLYPYATTSPIYVVQDGKPIRSASDARYFVAWIDRLVSAVERFPDWNSEAEKRETLETLRTARAEFERRVGP